MAKFKTKFAFEIDPVASMTYKKTHQRKSFKEKDVLFSLNEICDQTSKMFDVECSADDVLSIHVPEKGKFHYYNYLDTLREMGITNVTNTMDDMIVLDFLMMNTEPYKLLKEQVLHRSLIMTAQKC